MNCHDPKPELGKNVPFLAVILTRILSIMHGNFPILHSLLDRNIFHLLKYVASFTSVIHILGEG